MKPHIDRQCISVRSGWEKENRFCHGSAFGAALLALSHDELLVRLNQFVAAANNAVGAIVVNVGGRGLWTVGGDNAALRIIVVIIIIMSSQECRWTQQSKRLVMNTS